MIFVGLRARNQLILVKIIDFRPLVPQKLSVESSINDDVHEKRVSKATYKYLFEFKLEFIFAVNKNHSPLLQLY